MNNLTHWPGLTTHVTAQQSTPSQATATRASAEDETTGAKPAHYDAFEGLQSAPSAGKVALEGKRHQAPPQPPCKYPKLTDEFRESDPVAYELICSLDADGQHKVSGLFARKGRKAVLDLIHGNANERVNHE